jgi:hypothetical protein
MIYGGAAGGTMSGVLGFANEGRPRCRLAGWPTVVAAGRAGRARARRTLMVCAAEGLSAPPVVVLRPGVWVVAVFDEGEFPAPPLARCGPAYRRLLVTAPGSAIVHVVRARIPGYAHLWVPACTPIRVSPLVPFAVVSYLAGHGVSGWQRRHGRGVSGG